MVFKRRRRRKLRPLFRPKKRNVQRLLPVYRYLSTPKRVDRSESTSHLISLSFKREKNKEKEEEEEKEKRRSSQSKHEDTERERETRESPPRRASPLHDNKHVSFSSHPSLISLFFFSLSLVSFFLWLLTGWCRGHYSPVFGESAFLSDDEVEFDLFELLQVTCLDGHLGPSRLQKFLCFRQAPGIPNSQTNKSDISRERRRTDKFHNHRKTREIETCST